MRGPLVLLVLTVALALPAAVAAAPAPDPGPVLVRELGQPGMVSTVPQADLSLTSRGTCPFPRAPAEANGGASACPPGTWPGLTGSDVHADAAWYVAGVLGAAGGDTVQLTYPVAVDALDATATTNTALGLRPPTMPMPPPGVPSLPCANCDQETFNVDLGDLHPAPTADPAVWTIAVPALTPFERYGFVVALTAHSAGAARDDVFAASAPRLDDVHDACSLQFVNAGQIEHVCAKNAVPPGGGLVQLPAPNDGAAPRPAVTLTLTRHPRFHGSGLRLAVSTTTAGTLRVTLRSGGHRLLRRAVALPAGARTVIVVLPRTVRARLRAGAVYVVAARLAGPGGRTAALMRRVRWSR